MNYISMIRIIKIIHCEQSIIPFMYDKYILYSLYMVRPRSTFGRTVLKILKFHKKFMFLISNKYPIITMHI